MGSSLNISSAHIRNPSVIKNINVSSTRANGVVTPNDQPTRGTTTVISGLLKNTIHPVEKCTVTNLEYGQSTTPIMNDLINFSISPPVTWVYTVKDAFTGTCYFGTTVSDNIDVGQSGLNISVNPNLNEFIGNMNMYKELNGYQTDFQNWISGGVSNNQIKILTNPTAISFLPNNMNIQSQFLTINLSFFYTGNMNSQQSENSISFYCVMTDTYFGKIFSYCSDSSGNPELIVGQPANSSNVDNYIIFGGQGPISFLIPIQSGGNIDMQIFCSTSDTNTVYVTVTFDLTVTYSV